MSDSEVQRLWQALNVLSNNVASLTATINGQQSLISEMRKDIKDMTVNGCAKSTQHADHETRIRDVEKSRNMLAGISSLAGAAFGVVGGWLLEKVGGK